MFLLRFLFLLFFEKKIKTTNSKIGEFENSTYDSLKPQFNLNFKRKDQNKSKQLISNKKLQS